MSFDRFQFLEFGDQEVSPEQAAPSETLDAVPRELNASLLADGTTLAEVRGADPRGYGKYAEEDEDDALTLSRMAGWGVPGAAVSRLRVTEVFGDRGTAAGQFQYPTGLAVDGSGILFVADSYAHRLQRITPDWGVSVIGGRGTGRAQFLAPQGIATDAEDSFYVVEQGSGRVQKFTSEGVLTLVFGRAGHDPGEMSGPTAIAVAPGGDIYIADTGNSRVQRFTAEGRVQMTLGAPGPYGPGLSSPQAIAVVPGGGLYVAETFARRLIRFDPLGRPDLQIGGLKPQRTAGGPENDLSLSLNQPRALAFDPSGLLYVADAGEPNPLTGETRGRVQCLSLTEGTVIATVEKVGRSLGTLMRPGGLAVGPATKGQIRGDLYVADTMNHRILRFAWT